MGTDLDGCPRQVFTVSQPRSLWYKMVYNDEDLLAMEKEEGEQEEEEEEEKERRRRLF